MALSVVVSRDLLDKSPLELNARSSGREVVTVGPGSRHMLLQQAKSPVMDGAVLTGVTADMQNATVVVRCYGTTPTQLLNRVRAVEEAFNQFTYEVTVSIDGSVETWTCYPADHARGASGVYEAARLRGGWQDVAFDVPRLPTSYGY